MKIMKKLFAIVLSLNICFTMMISYESSSLALSAVENTIDMSSSNLWGTNTGSFGTASGGILSLPMPAGGNWAYRASTFSDQYFKTSFILNFDMPNSNDMYFGSNNPYFRFDFNLKDPTKPFDAAGNTGYSIAIAYNYISVMANTGTGAPSVIMEGVFIVPAAWTRSSSALSGATVGIEFSKDANNKNVITVTINGSTANIGCTAGGYGFPFVDTASAVPDGSGFLVADKSMSATISDPNYIKDIAIDSPDTWGSNTGNYGTYANSALTLPSPTGGNWAYRASTFSDQYFKTSFILNFDMPNSNDMYFGSNNPYFRFDFNLKDPTKPFDAAGNTGYSIAIAYNYISVMANTGTGAPSVIMEGLFIVPAAWTRSSSALSGATVGIEFSKDANNKNIISVTINGSTANIGCSAGGLGFPFTDTVTSVPNGTGFLVADKSMTATLSVPSVPVTSTKLSLTQADTWGDNTGEYGTFSDGTLALPEPSDGNWAYRASTFSGQCFDTSFQLNFDLSQSDEHANYPNDYFRFDFNLADPSKPYDATGNTGYSLTIGYNSISLKVNDGTAGDPRSLMSGTSIVPAPNSPSSTLLSGSVIDISFKKDANNKNVITLKVNGNTLSVGNVSGGYGFPFTDTVSTIPDGKGFLIANKSMTASISDTHTIQNINLGQSSIWADSNYGTVNNNTLSLPRPTNDIWAFKATTFTRQCFQTSFVLNFDKDSSKSNDTYDNSDYNSNYFRFDFDLADPTKPIGADLGGGSYNSGYALAFGYESLVLLTNDGTSAASNITSTGLLNGSKNVVKPIIDGSLINISYVKNANGKNQITLSINGKLTTTLADGATPMFPYIDNVLNIPDGSGFVVENHSMTATMTGLENLNFADKSNWNLNSDQADWVTFDKTANPPAAEFKEKSQMFAMHSNTANKNFSTSFNMEITPNDVVNYSNGYDGYGGLEFRMTSNNNQIDGVEKINSTKVVNEYSLVFVPISAVSPSRQVQLWAYNNDKSAHYLCTANWKISSSPVPAFDDGNNHLFSITAEDIGGVPLILVMIDGMLVISFSDDGQGYLPDDSTPADTSVITPSGGYMQFFSNQTKLSLSDATGIALQIDKSSLQASISLAATKDVNQYTTASWNAMLSALSAANLVNANVNATQTQIDIADSNLETGINALVDRSSTTDITAVIERAQALTASDYSVSSFEAMQTLLTAAISLSANADATAKQLLDAATILQTAIEALVNLNQLKNMISTVNGLSSGDYSSSSWSPLVTELGNAQQLITKSNVTTAEITSEVNTLQGLMDALVPLATKDTLSSLVTIAESKDAANYTSSSFAQLKASLESAQTALANAGISQADVNLCVSALQSSIVGLIPLGNKTALNATILSIADLNPADYTAESWTNLQAVVATAKATNMSKDAIQDTVDSVNNELNDAITSLVLKIDIPQLVASKNDFKQISGSNQQLIYTTKDSDGNVLYKWIFNGKTITNTNVDVNLGITLNNSPDKDAIDSLTDNADGVYLSFANSGNLPGPADIMIYVGDKYNDGDILNLYYFDKENNCIEIAGQNIAVYSGYVTITIRHCSEYFLSTANIDANLMTYVDSQDAVMSANTSDNLNMPLLFVILFLTLLASGALIVQKIYYINKKG